MAVYWDWKHQGEGKCCFQQFVMQRGAAEAGAYTETSSFSPVALFHTGVGEQGLIFWGAVFGALPRCVAPLWTSIWSTNKVRISLYNKKKKSQFTFESLNMILLKRAVVLKQIRSLALRS